MYVSQISSIFSPPDLFSTSLHPTLFPGAWTGWSILTGALPSGFQMELFFSVYSSFSFWFLESCHLFSPSGLIAVTGLLLLGPGFCTLHCAHILVITPFVNNPSQITILWRCQPFPAVIQSYMSIVHTEVCRYFSFWFLVVRSLSELQMSTVTSPIFVPFALQVLLTPSAAVSMLCWGPEMSGLSRPCLLTPCAHALPLCI